jgi:hypothetical protein
LLGDFAEAEVARAELNELMFGFDGVVGFHRSIG